MPPTTPRPIPALAPDERGGEVTEVGTMIEAMVVEDVVLEDVTVDGEDVEETIEVEVEDED